VRFFSFVYERFGAPGLLLVPFVSLTMEKTAYDTFQAFRGHDIYTRGVAEGARGGFPSGGNELPSFSLIPVQSWKLAELEKEETATTADCGEGNDAGK
jgi:hypothetical protein